MAWYKIVMQRSLMMYQEISLTCHLYFLGIDTRLKAHVCAEKIQVTSGIFHGISIESIA